MRKRHFNSSSIAHNSLYHLQQGLDRTSIPIATHIRIGGGLRCIRRDYIKEWNPPRKEIGTIEPDWKDREYQLVPSFKQIIYEHCLLKQARGRVLCLFCVPLNRIKCLDFINFILGSARGRVLCLLCVSLHRIKCLDFINFILWSYRALISYLDHTK